MPDDLSVQIIGGVPTIDDGATVHSFADPAALRRFLHVWRVLRAQFPAAVFALNDDATIQTWSGPDAQPTPTQIAAAVTAYRAAEDQRATDTAALRTHILTLAQSAVGQSIDTLTAGQVRALVACLIYKAGAIDTAGVVRPLGAWL